MSKATPSAQAAKASKGGRITIPVKDGNDTELRVAEQMLGPYIPSALAASAMTMGTFGKISLDKIAFSMIEAAKRVKGGDMRDVEAILLSQATALNGMFADLASRSAQNRNGGYFDAAEKYLKLAFKAQNQCRMTLETLSTVKNPPVVYAKQANISHGPQQVNNGAATPPRAEKTESAPNKLLEASDEKPMDTGAKGASGGSDMALAAVGEVDRAENG